MRAAQGNHYTQCEARRPVENPAGPVQNGLRMGVGEETPDAGTVKLGDTVELCYVDQNRDALDDNATIYEEISIK